MPRVSLSALVAVVMLAVSCAPSAQQPSFDQQFIDMMVPHHEGAVEMAAIAQNRSTRPEIRQMLVMIIAAQQAEIAQMRTWRQAWFGSNVTPPMDKMPMVPGMSADHGSHGVMNMQADVDRLRSAPEPFDRAFIDAMVPHHESAIDAAKAAATRAQRTEIKDLARVIIIDQQREIDQMRSWRQAWFGSATPGSG